MIFPFWSNMVKNPGFERGIANWGYTQGVLVTSPVATGKYSLKCERTRQSYPGLVKTTDYYFGFKYKAVDPDKLIFYSQAIGGQTITLRRDRFGQWKTGVRFPRDIAVLMDDRGVGDGWRRVQCKFRATVETLNRAGGYGQFYVSLYWPGALRYGGKYYIDDIWLSDYPYPSFDLYWKLDALKK